MQQQQQQQRKQCNLQFHTSAGAAGIASHVTRHQHDKYCKREHIYTQSGSPTTKYKMCALLARVGGIWIELCCTAAGHNCSVAFLALLLRYLKTFDAEDAEKT